MLFSRAYWFTLGQARPPSGGCHENLSRSKQIMDLVSGSHSIGQNLYHLEWCPKYRYNMFRGKKNKKLCEDILHEVAERHNIGIVELSVMPWSHSYRRATTINDERLTSIASAEGSIFLWVVPTTTLVSISVRTGKLLESGEILSQCRRRRYRNCIGVR